MWLARFYDWFWWHSEWFIVDHHLKRPYTYIFRDYPWGCFAFIVVLGGSIWFTGTWWARVPVWAFIVFLSGHVWWGSKIVHGQQEEPEYLPC